MHFNVHCRCIFQSSFGQHLLCMFNNYITMSPGRIKNWGLYFGQYLPAVRGQLAPVIPSTSVACCALAPLWQFVVHFPQSDERTWVTWQENAIEADSESFLMEQPSHIWWDYKNSTQDIICAICAIKTACLHYLNGHYPYNSIYPQPYWDDSNYSYPSLIRRGTNVCGHSAIYWKFNWVERVLVEEKM